MATKVKTIGEPIVGVVHGVQQRAQVGVGGHMTVWNFRVDRYDTSGNPMPPVPVQMQGYSFDGFINDGDQVELPIKASRDWDPGELVQVKQVRNITTGATFIAHGMGRFLTVFIVIFLLIWLGVCAFILWHAMAGF